jgi:hypothetical protein
MKELPGLYCPPSIVDTMVEMWRIGRSGFGRRHACKGGQINDQFNPPLPCRRNHAAKMA